MATAPRTPSRAPGGSRASREGVASVPAAIRRDPEQGRGSRGAIPARRGPPSHRVRGAPNRMGPRARPRAASGPWRGVAPGVARSTGPRPRVRRRGSPGRQRGRRRWPVGRAVSEAWAPSCPSSVQPACRTAFGRNHAVPCGRRSAPPRRPHRTRQPRLALAATRVAVAALRRRRWHRREGRVKVGGRPAGRGPGAPGSAWAPGVAWGPDAVVRRASCLVLRAQKGRASGLVARAPFQGGSRANHARPRQCAGGRRVFPGRPELRAASSWLTAHSSRLLEGLRSRTSAPVRSRAAS